MTLIPFREGNPSPPPGSWVVQWSGGAFDVRQALRDGNGVFTVDDQMQAGLVTALLQFPGVYRADGVGTSVPPQYGLLAARPPASAVPNGWTYFATDDNGGTLYQVQSAAWVKIAPRGVELGYAQITSDFPTASGSFVDVTGLTVTVTVGSRPILVKARSRQLQNNTSGDGGVVQLVQGASTVIADASAGFSGLVSIPLHMEARLSLASGSYTFKVQLSAAIGGTMKLAATATSPAFIQVVEC